MRRIVGFIFTLFLLFTKWGVTQETAYVSGEHSRDFSHADTTNPADYYFYGNDSAYLLIPVQVRARIIPAQAMPILPAQIITRENPAWQNSLSVADAVRYFSGVQLKDYGGIGGLKTINVRSMGTNHMSIFMDGIPLGGSQNGQVDLGKYAMDNLQSISLFNGQQNSLLQPARAYSSGSALYLQSKMPDLDSGRLSQSKVGIKVGSFGRWSPSVYTARRLGRCWKMTFQAGGLFTKGDYPYRYTNAVYDTTLRRENGDVKSYHGNVSLEHHFKDSSRLRIYLYGYSRKMGLPGAIVSNQFTNQERQAENNYYVQANYFKRFGKRDQLKMLFKYNKDNLTYRNPEIQRIYLNGEDTLQGPLVNHYHESSYYGSIANMYQITPYWQASIALDLVHDQLYTDLYGFTGASRWTTYLAAASRLSLGSLEIEGNLLATSLTDKTKTGKATSSKQELTPGISVGWRPFKSPGFQVRGFYKQAFRMPTFNDLYYTQVGTVTLRPEYVSEYDLGLRYEHAYSSHLKKVSFQLDGYYNHVRDKIVAIPTTSLFRWQMTNLGKVRILGVDFSGHTNMQWDNVKIMTALTYTYQQARDRTDTKSQSYNGQIPYIPTHSGSLVIGINVQNWDFKYSLLYDGERYSQTYNSLDNYVPAWYTHDLGLFYHYAIGKNATLELSLQVDNLLNQYYDVIINYPMPGRSYKIGMGVNF